MVALRKVVPPPTEETVSDDWAASEATDWRDGRHARSNEFVAGHGGVITDDDARELLTTFRSVYRRAAAKGWIDGREWPADHEETEMYRRLRDFHETETFSERVRDGDETGLRSHVGSQSEEIDVSGWDSIEQIRNIMADTPLLLYIFGFMGHGKTSAAMKCARHWYLQMDAPNVEIGTNMMTAVEETDEISHWISNWDQLDDWMREDESDVLAGDVNPKLFIFDEANSHAGGGGSDGYEAKTKLATLVYKIRKYGGSLIIVGHDGKDIHPAIRELCTIMHKKNLKTAQFFRNVVERQGRDPLTPELGGWPDTKWSVNDRDLAKWSWDDGSGDSDGENGEESVTQELEFRDMAIWTVVRERQKDDPLGHQKIAEKRLEGAYSGEWCRRRWKDWQQGKLREEVGRVEEQIK